VSVGQTAAAVNAAGPPTPAASVLLSAQSHLSVSDLCRLPSRQTDDTRGISVVQVGRAPISRMAKTRAPAAAAKRPIRCVQNAAAVLRASWRGRISRRRRFAVRVLTVVLVYGVLQVGPSLVGGCPTATPRR